MEHRKIIARVGVQRDIIKQAHTAETFNLSGRKAVTPLPVTAATTEAPPPRDTRKAVTPPPVDNITKNIVKEIVLQILDAKGPQRPKELACAVAAETHISAATAEAIIRHMVNAGELDTGRTYAGDVCVTLPNSMRQDPRPHMRG